MGDVIPIHSRRTFTKDEADSILPIVRRITEAAALHARDINEQLKWVPGDEPLSVRLRQDLDLVVRRWAVKVSRLGCAPRGIWLVDFDAGEGWYSWRYGDEHLSYFHPHSEPSVADLAADEGRLFT